MAAAAIDVAASAAAGCLWFPAMTGAETGVGVEYSVAAAVADTGGTVLEEVVRAGAAVDVDSMRNASDVTGRVVVIGTDAGDEVSRGPCVAGAAAKTAGIGVGTSGGAGSSTLTAVRGGAGEDEVSIVAEEEAGIVGDTRRAGGAGGAFDDGGARSRPTSVSPCLTR